MDIPGPPSYALETLNRTGLTHNLWNVSSAHLPIDQHVSHHFISLSKHFGRLLIQVLAVV